MSIQQELSGFYLAGKVLGARDEPWSKNGKSGVNHRLRLSQDFIDGWGEVTENRIIVDISHDAWPRVQGQLSDITGKMILIRVVPRARQGGRDGAWLSYYYPANSELIIQSDILRQPVRAAS